MSETGTPWKRLRDNTYLGQHDFDPGEKKTFTVDRMISDDVTDDKGRKKKEPIMFFREAVKPMIVNATNCRKMEELSGSKYIEDWSGLKIIIGVDPKVRFGGKVTGGMRIIGKVSADKPTKIAYCSDCKKPITGYGNMTPAQVAANTAGKFGQALCVACGQKRADAEKQVDSNVKE